MISKTILALMLVTTIGIPAAYANPVLIFSNFGFDGKSYDLTFDDIDTKCNDFDDIIILVNGTETTPSSCTDSFGTVTIDMGITIDTSDNVIRHAGDSITGNQNKAAHDFTLYNEGLTFRQMVDDGTDTIDEITADLQAPDEVDCTWKIFTRDQCVQINENTDDIATVNGTVSDNEQTFTDVKQKFELVSIWGGWSQNGMDNFNEYILRELLSGTYTFQEAVDEAIDYAINNEGDQDLHDELVAFNSTLNS